MGEVNASEERKSSINEESRIWITSEPHPKFPIGLLQMSIKLTNEPPQGIRAGIVRSYSWLSQDALETFRRPEWKPLLFTQCFLHSVVQERRKFGPIGFCVPYEFNQGDWAASVQFLQNHLTLIGEDVRKGAVSWETIQYMVADIQYGGRITDNKDRELFFTITEKLFDPAIVQQNFAYAPGYGLPQSDDINKHREFVRDTYPDVDMPRVFGMANNADITYRSRQAQLVLSTILDVQPRSSGGSGTLTREQTVLKITESYLRQLPERWDPDKREKLGDKAPLSIFAGQEIDRLKVTIRVIRQTCVDLKLAVDGTIIMSPTLQDALDFLYDGRVPPSWTAVSWPSPAVLSWFGEVLRRHEQLDNWARFGRQKFYWFGGFFNPQGFLTSVRQEITRHRSASSGGASWALDSVITKTEVRSYDFKPGQMDGRDEGIETGAVQIYGLSLDGCAWNRDQGVLVDAKYGQLFNELPVMVVSAGLPGERRDDAKKGKQALPTYKCPVYKYPNRTDNNWIFDVELPCREGDDFWRLRGVCLLCSTE